MSAPPKIAKSVPRAQLAMLLGGGLFVVVVILATIGWALAEGRTHAHRTAEVVTANLARTLAESIADAVANADLGSQAIVDEIVAQRQAGRTDDDRLRAVIGRQDRLHPNLVGYRVFGADGKLALALKNPGVARPDVSAEPDFIALRDAPPAGPSVSAPFFGPLANTWLIRLGRRIDNPDGSFGGAVFAALPVAHLAEKFAAIDLGAHGAVALYHDGGRLALRFPALDRPGGMPGTSNLAPEFRAVIESKAETGGFDYVSPVDAVERTARVQKLAGAPYHLLVALAKDDYLAQWHRDLRSAAVVGGILVGLVLVLTVALYRRMEAWQGMVRELADSEQTLRDSEERYRSLVQSQADFVVRFDLAGGLLFVNDALAAAFARPVQSMLGESWQVLVLPEDLEVTRRAIAKALVGPDFRATVENRILLPSGPRWVAWEGGGIHDARGKLVEVQAVGRDISEWVAQRERLKAAVRELDASNQDLEQFAYVASHDLREPLRMVSMYVTLLAKRYGDKLDQDAKDFIAFAYDGAQRMDHLIRDLLDYSRIGRLGEPKDEVDLAAVAEQAVAVLGLAIAEAGALVEVASSMPQVSGNPADLARLFQNLIGNAIKYRSPDRPPRVAVTAERQGGEWLIKVADNGIGIPADARERVFGIFQRLHGRAEYDGTGIGLASAKRIVEQHGGRIWIEGEPGVGSTFCFTLPETRD